MVELSSKRVRKLPRGGTRVETSIGPIQIGIPPETIKDSMELDLPVATHYVVPKVRFDRQKGINIAEFEFPAYYNFFILRRRVNLITTPDGEARIRQIVQETLFGPESVDLDNEYSENVPKSVRPDLKTEFAYFRKNPFNPSELMQVEDLISFTHFDESGIATIEDQVQVKIDGDFYDISDGGKDIARVSGQVELPAFERVEVKKTFSPPLFGITVLGTSHGFDPKGKTTGFVLWINRRGLVVDPPIYSGRLLRENGIPSRLIDGLILTHCHADHDAGTFQKILEESKISVMATPTVMGSFLRKYTALSGLDENTLRRLFVYRPARPGDPIKHNGAELRFFYSLHSIPAVGFEVYYGGKSFVFSGDTCNFPDRIKEMCEEGVLSEGRRDFLLNFPWHHSVILHEAGVPPLHTPIQTLVNLPDSVKERLYLCHIAEKDVPKDQNLRLARPGVEHTIRIPVDKPVHSDAIELLDLVENIEFFRNFDIRQAREVLQMASKRSYAKSETIIHQGAVGDRFFIISSGVASVHTANGETKQYTTGDYFGETSIVTGKKRNATITAVTDVELIEFDRYDFQYLLRGTDIMDRMRHLAEMRQEHSWKVINSNSALAALTSAQKTQLQAILQRVSFQKGLTVWAAGSPAEMALLVDEGLVKLTDKKTGEIDSPFGPGAFIGDFNALSNCTEVTSTLEAVENVEGFAIYADDLRSFFERNPGVQLAFLKTQFVE